MHLAPREIDKLLLHNAGFLAQKRLARGLRLNHPETVALLATQLLEFIREGKRVSELMDLGKRILGRNQVNIATVSMGRDRKAGTALACLNVDGEVPPNVLRELEGTRGIVWVRQVSV